MWSWVHVPLFCRDPWAFNVVSDPTLFRCHFGVNRQIWSRCTVAVHSDEQYKTWEAKEGGGE